MRKNNRGVDIWKYIEVSQGNLFKQLIYKQKKKKKKKKYDP
jgi:hypothetical protein